VYAILYTPDLVLEVTLFLIDGSYWVWGCSVVKYIFPLSLFEVTGYSDRKLYGYRRNKKYMYNLKTHAYSRVKDIKTNIVSMFADRIIDGTDSEVFDD